MIRYLATPFASVIKLIGIIFRILATRTCNIS